jgi:hypothetical protein
MTGLIQLSRAQWVIVGTFLAVVFPLLLLLVFMPAVADWFIVATLAPELERDLGFHAAVAKHPAFPTQQTFHVVSVVPCGAFDRAGIRPGDIPTRIHHGRGDFYALLRDHRGATVELRILRISSGPSDAFLAEHRVRVVVPRPAPLVSGVRYSLARGWRG